MRKKKTSKLYPWASILAGIVAFSPINKFFAKAQFNSKPDSMVSPGALVYGPPPPTGGEIFLRILVFASVLLIPVAFLIGIIVYFKKRKKRINQNVEENPQDGQS